MSWVPYCTSVWKIAVIWCFTGDTAEHDLFVPALLPPLKCCRRSLLPSQGRQMVITKFPITLPCLLHSESMKPELQSSAWAGSCAATESCSACKPLNVSSAQTLRKCEISLQNFKAVPSGDFCSSLNYQLGNALFVSVQMLGVTSPYKE